MKCILPKCSGETTEQARFCLDCMTFLSTDMRGKLLEANGRTYSTGCQAEWSYLMYEFNWLADRAYEVCEKKRQRFATRSVLSGVAKDAGTGKAAAEQVLSNAAAGSGDRV